MILEVPKVYTRAKVQWRKWMHQNFKGFRNVKMDVIRGRIPGNLRGSLFKNTSACLVRNKQRAGHIYDGDGGILKVDIQDGSAYASLKFIETESYKKESKSDSFTELGWGNTLPFHQKFMRNTKIKNTANASLYKFQNSSHLLALGYHGLPYKVDPESLETIGEENFNGKLNSDQTMGLNFKACEADQIVYNFSYDMHRGKLSLYQFDYSGNIIGENSYSLKKPSLFVQDFCLAGDYMVFIVAGQFLGTFNSIFGKKALWDKITYEQNGGTYIMIFNKHTLELVSEEECDPLYVRQFGNGFQFKNGNILIDAIIHPDSKHNSLLQQIVGERIETNGFNGKLHRMEINPTSGILYKSLKREVHPCELPQIQKKYLGEQFSEVFMCVNSMRKEFDIGNTVCKLDRKNQLQVYRDKNHDTFLRQPILSEDGKYVFSLGLNCDSGDNELHVIDSESMEQVCVLALEEQVPFPTQGIWVDNNQVDNQKQEEQ